MKIGQIVALTGPQTFPDLAAGSRAAVQTENQQCRLGRPIELIQCDGKNDPNVAADCARKLVADKIVALASSVDPALDSGMPIIYAAGIPDVANSAISSVESLSPLSYPLVPSAMFTTLGSLAIARATGAKSIVYGGPDVPGSAFLAGIVQRDAPNFGLKFDGFIRVPNDATDLTPYAQQALAGGGAINFAAAEGMEERFLNALIAAGVDFKKRTVTVPLSTTRPDLIAKLGSKIDGLLLYSVQWPVTDLSNPGVAAYQKEVRALPGNNAIGVAGVTGLDSIHVIVDLLKQVKTINSASLVARLNQGYDVNRPEIAPASFGKPAFPNDPALSKLRVFTRQIVVTEAVGGKIKPVTTGYVDVEKPFQISNR